MRRILFCFFPFIFCIESYAQPYFDVLKFHAQLSDASKSTVNDSVKIQTTDYCAELNIPLKLKNNILAFSPSYTRLNVFPDMGKDFEENSILLSVAFVHQWKNPKIKTNFVAIGRLNYDSDIEIDERSLQSGVAIIHNIRKHGHLVYKFGVYYNAEFFGPFILPLAGIDWNISPRMNLFGILPGSMNLEYKMTKKLHTGLSFRSITNSYRLLNDHFIRINDNHIRLFLDFYAAPRHVLFIEAGHSVLRKYKPGIRINSETRYSDLKVNDGYLLKAGYAFRFRLDKRSENQKKPNPTQN